MSNLRIHCEDCLKELGEEFRFVHEWLDELFKYSGPDHRDYRHNHQGIEEIRRRWGDRAARAAEIHITRDEEDLRGGVEIRYDKEDRGENLRICPERYLI
jgi:hypothetical protein